MSSHLSISSIALVSNVFLDFRDTSSHSTVVHHPRWIAVEESTLHREKQATVSLTEYEGDGVSVEIYSFVNPALIKVMYWAKCDDGVPSKVTDAKRGRKRKTIVTSSEEDDEARQDGENDGFG
ncbi:hypothetical protein TSUD_261880 [Trifolium subterraneum]|nr:hypothetical protein TSUD_261880 [Trifolium subterraneum]